MERWQSWSIASDLKSDEVQASVGSNPTFSVKETLKIDNLLYLYLVHALAKISMMKSVIIKKEVSS